MFLIAVLVLLGAQLTVNGETHSLTYIYSALSKPVSNPGIHQFIAMSLLDDKMMDYYDSETQVQVPKQNWMKERLLADHWEEGTRSSRSKQQWFKVNIDILMKRMRQNDSDIHVLQCMRGCVGDLQDNGSIKFKCGIDKYNYDGSDFSFDDENGLWVASVRAAIPTKRKWDGDQKPKEMTIGYLENECIMWLKEFLHYEQKHLKEVQAEDSNTGAIIGGVIAGLVFVVGVMMLLWKMGYLGGAKGGTKDKARGGVRYTNGGASSIVNTMPSTVITMPDKSPANEDDDRASSCSKDDGRASSCSSISDYVKHSNVSLDGSDSGVSSGRRESQTPESASLLNNP